MNMSAIFSQMGILFLIIAIGYAANKFKILTPESNKLLSRVVVNIAMPCTILSSVLSGEVTASGSDAAFFILMAFAAYLLAFLISGPLPWIIRAKKSDNGLYRFMIVFANVGFMGFPVIQAIFGTGAVFYVTLFNIAFSLLCFSIGIIMVAGKGEKLNPRLFINPTMVVSVVTVILFYTKLQVPAVIADTAVLVGKMTTPSAMLIIGSTLAAIPFKQVFGDFRLYTLSVFKLIVVPLITWLALRWFISDPMTLGVLVTLAAMPTASNATMLSMEYGGNETLASKGIFITTLLSVATIPLLMSLLFT